MAGIVAANATGITQAGFIPFQPFLGVAPQATIGACKLLITTEIIHFIFYCIDRVFGCAGDSTSTGMYESKYVAKRFSMTLLTNLFRCHDRSHL